jgi:hypothetical protein
MFDWLRKLLSRDSTKRTLVRHVAIAFRGGETSFVAVEVPEAEYLRKVREKKGEFLLRAKPDGDVVAICNSCRVPLDVAQQDELVWFRCPHCRRVSFNPTANVQRNVQFAIQDGEAFEEEMYFVREIPPVMVPPFAAEESNLAAEGQQAVTALPKQPTVVFTVEHVFYADPPVDRVILVGTIHDGTVKVGDSLTVQCQGGDVAVVLEGIETLDRGPVRQASRGQEVGIKLRGIRKEQAAPGDRVVANAL